jgi:membrane dipeptidase
MLGNSLSVLRIWAQLGVRYMTLTHTNHNGEWLGSSDLACADGLSLCGGPMTAVHPGNGLSKLGEALIGEMNRLGSE